MSEVIDHPFGKPSQELTYLETDLGTIVSVEELQAPEEIAASICGVTVLDGYSDPSNYELIQTKIGEYIDEVLAEGNFNRRAETNASRRLYASSQTLVEWRKHIPTARALEPLYHPDLEMLPGTDTPIDELTRNYFMNCDDALGIRSRAVVLQQLIKEEASSLEEGRLNIASLASGAATPVLNAAESLNRQDKLVSLSLFDKDKSALHDAMHAAKKLDFTALRPTEIDLFDLEAIEKIKTNEYDFVEILGLFEYLPESYAQNMLWLGYMATKPGGKLVFANMLDTHPQLDFTLHAVQWPMIRPRSMSEVMSIIEGTNLGPDGGLLGPEHDVEIYLPNDGVYALYSITKPLNAECAM